MKRLSFCLSVMLLLAGTACQKEDQPFDESVARIVKLVVTSVGRNDGDNAATFPYQMDYTINASLNDISGVEEWGIYFKNGDDPIEFSFETVAHEGTIDMYWNTKASLLHVGETTSYIEVNREIGLYIKKKGKTTYGEMTNYRLLYEFPSKPSVVYSNPKIVSQEEVEVDGVNKYRTVYSYDITVAGSFWIEYLEDVLSSGWKWNSESHYSLKDGTHTRSHTMTYSPVDVQYSQWALIHCYDTEDTIESGNWLNVSGYPSITKIEVSDFERNI